MLSPNVSLIDMSLSGKRQRRQEFYRTRNPPFFIASFQRIQPIGLCAKKVIALRLHFALVTNRFHFVETGCVEGEQNLGRVARQRPSQSCTLSGAKLTTMALKMRTVTIPKIMWVKSCHPSWDVSASGLSCTRLTESQVGSKSAGTSSCNPAGQIC